MWVMVERLVVVSSDLARGKFFQVAVLALSGENPQLYRECAGATRKILAASRAIELCEASGSY
jgi:hypothetical protein